MDARFREHRPPMDHPERPERLVAIETALFEAQLLRRCHDLPARPVTDEEILRAHSRPYLDALRDRLGQAAANGTSGYLDPDTYYSPASLVAAELAAGAAVDLALRVLESGDKDNGLSLCRPPGHHATRDTSMGFCLLNNVAIAAAAAKARGARVAIVDFDVHHGNGTEDIFSEDPDVLYISTHQYPLYPGTGPAGFTGRGRGKGATVNIPLPARSGDQVYLRAFAEIITPVLARFAPDLLLCSAGFDGHARDPLAEMALSSASFGAMARSLLAAQPRFAAVLEGGYSLGALGESVVSFTRALLGDAPEAQTTPDEGESAAVQQEAQATMDKVKRVHGL